MANKKPKPSFKVGDLVTGVDRSFQRSIYKMLSTTENPKVGLFEFQSWGNDVLERWIDAETHPSRCQCLRNYTDFRLASRVELRDGDKARCRYFIFRLLRKLGVKPNSESIYP